MLFRSLILICVALIPRILNMIPLSALAAILLMTGYKLAKPALFKQMWTAGKYQFVPFVVTVVAIIFSDLLTGVGIGTAVAVFAILRGNMKAPYFFHKKEYNKNDVIKIDLSQEVSFLNKASIKLTLDHLPPNSTVAIDASNTLYIDYDVLEIIKEFQKINAPERNIKLLLTGFKEDYKINNADLVHSEMLEMMFAPTIPQGKPADELLEDLTK